MGNVQVIECNSMPELSSALQMLSGLGGYIYRGQTSDAHKLSSTLNRFRGCSQFGEWDNYCDHMHNQFLVGLQHIDFKVPSDLTTLDLIEMARHYGLPSPCIDFSYSHYVALFFAFSNVTTSVVASDYVALYALNVYDLALGWANRNNVHAKDMAEFTQRFCYPMRDGDYLDAVFSNGLPYDKLIFIPFPGVHSKRMQRQQGCFVYDTIDYSCEDCCDLEDFINTMQVRSVGERPADADRSAVTMFKIRIQKAGCTSGVLKMLESANILGRMLYDSPEGVVNDVKNSYFYNSMSLYSRKMLIRKS